MQPVKLLILEDEAPATELIKKRVAGLRQSCDILFIADSLSSAVQWWSTTDTMPGLILSDINLSDGLCFEFFTKMQISVPVIFTTAFDEFLLHSFKLNAVDYLLKPIAMADLQASFDKFEKFNLPKVPAGLLQNIYQNKINSPKAYRLRYLVDYRESILVIDTTEIVYLNSEGRLFQVYTQDGKLITVDSTLEQAEAELDPKQFFRLNRQFIVSQQAIQSILKDDNGKLRVAIKGLANYAVVSKERAPLLKRWLEGFN